MCIIIIIVQRKQTAQNEPQIGIKIIKSSSAYLRTGGPGDKKWSTVLSNIWSDGLFWFHPPLSFIYSGSSLSCLMIHIQPVLSHCASKLIFFSSAQQDCGGQLLAMTMWTHDGGQTWRNFHFNILMSPHGSMMCSLWPRPSLNRRRSSPSIKQHNVCIWVWRYHFITFYLWCFYIKLEITQSADHLQAAHFPAYCDLHL